MITRLWEQFIRDLFHQPLTIIMEIFGTGVGILASVLVCLQLTTMFNIFILWIVGSVCLTISSVIRKNTLLALLMLFYTVMNFIGLGKLM